MTNDDVVSRHRSEFRQYSVRLSANIHDYIQQANDHAKIEYCQKFTLSIDR